MLTRVQYLVYFILPFPPHLDRSGCLGWHLLHICRLTLPNLPHQFVLYHNCNLIKQPLLIIQAGKPRICNSNTFEYSRLGKMVIDRFCRKHKQTSCMPDVAAILCSWLLSLVLFITLPNHTLTSLELFSQTLLLFLATALVVGGKDWIFCYLFRE